MSVTGPWFADLPLDSEMGRRVKTMDWESTPLGAPEDWPSGLRTAAAICLNSEFPMLVIWGPERIQLYNDAFITIVGGKHPQLACRMQDTWAEVFAFIGPLMDDVIATGKGVFFEETLLWIDRLGYLEDTYFTFSYTAVPAGDGTNGGILCAAIENTQQVLDARRLRALGELSVAIARGPSRDEVIAEGLGALSGHAEDIPFAVLYLRDPGTGELRLAAGTGVPDGWTLAPEQLEPAPGTPPAGPGEPHLIHDLGAGPILHALSGRPVLMARVMPLNGHGVLVAGLSPARRIDEHYLGYLDLVASALARGIDAADALTGERERADALAALDRAKTEFLQNVSHELRTPLTLIRAPVADLLDDRVQPLTAPQRGKAELIQRNAERLLRLVNGLLDFSRASSESPAPEPTDLPATTTQLVSLFAPAAARAGLELHVDCDPASAAVLVDREAWERIVLNLLSNAVKFTEAGRITVTLRVGDGAAELRIADTGLGIAAEDLERVFERFGRARHEGARSHEGVGIGLALVQQLARRLGGDAHVESAPGAGSVFTVRVAAPRVDGVAAAVAPSLAATAAAVEAERWTAAPATPVPADERPLVLCADDSADMREYIAGILAGEYRVRTVGDGPEALDAARAELPQLILSDVMMPRMDGLELVRELRADPRTAAVPVVMLSARAGDEASVTGLEAGADDYIVKPFSPRELRARVRTHVELARARTLIAATEHERRTTALMTASERRLRAALSAAGTGLALGDVDAGGDNLITDVNPSLCQLLRRAASELRGTTLRALTDPEDLPILVQEQERLRAGQGTHATIEVRLLRGDGVPVWAALELSVAPDEEGAVTLFVAGIRDAGERRQHESRLRYLADHDGLTGLLNRRRFGEELERLTAECHRYGIDGAVLMLDLDGLKSVNDLHGHAQGDKLLCGIADLMRGRMRETDVLARLGGDEFALLLPRVDRASAATVAQDLLHRIRQGSPVLLGGTTTRLTASVGIAQITGDGPWRTAEETLAEADNALYMAKRSGRNCVRVASAPLRQEASRLRASWSDRIHAALAADRFELFGQPIVGIGGDDRPRYELLLRLHGEAGRVLAPGSFLADAERSDVILDIDCWVIRQSARVLAAWERERGPVTLHVNLSSRTITAPGTPDLIAAELAAAGVDGRGLVYEITETTAITSIDLAQEFATRMRKLGCGLALDDFGSGFASFTYLKHLDYDYIKVDGSLIQEAACNLRDQRILHCIADLARDMGKRVIAECVPDAATVQLLQDFGIEYAQGYHLGEPRSLEAAGTVAPGA